MSVNQFDSAVQAGTLDKDNIYDPDNNPVVTSDNFLRFSIRSARTVTVNSQPLLKLLHLIILLMIQTPQPKTVPYCRDQYIGSTFTVSKTSSTVSNRVGGLVDLVVSVISMLTSTLVLSITSSERCWCSSNI